MSFVYFICGFFVYFIIGILLSLLFYYLDVKHDEEQDDYIYEGYIFTWPIFIIIFVIPLRIYRWAQNKIRKKLKKTDDRKDYFLYEEE